MPPSRKRPPQAAITDPAPARGNEWPAALQARSRGHSTDAAKTPAARGLSAAQKRHLRGLAHALNPVILIGQKGITSGLLKEFDLALAHHELLKVRLGGADREEREAQIAELVGASGAELVQTIGHVACFYKRNADEPRLVLPK